MIAFPLFRGLFGLSLAFVFRAPFALGEGVAVRIATFNIEWLGYPWKSGEWYGSRESQIRAAAEEMLAVDADLFALQEVIVDEVNGDALADLLVQLNELDDGERWEGVYNEKFSYWWDPDFADYPAQRQAYVWRTPVVAYSGSGNLLDWIPAWDDRFGSGRLPMLLQVEVGEGDFRFPLHLVNLHLKCCRGSDDRRRRSMTTLMDKLHTSYADVPLVVLGDFNVADDGGAYGEIADWGFYEDADGDGGPDFFHAAGAVADLSWDDIDHILLSDELASAYERVPEALRNVVADSFVSDHGPVVTQLLFEPTVGQRYAVWSGAAFAEDPVYEGKSGYRDDPDGDGLVNYLEFAFGGNPTVMDASEAGPEIVNSEEGDLLLSYEVRRSLAGDGVRVLSASDPASWSVLDLGEAAVSVEPGDSADFDRVTLRVPGPATGEARFFRLEVDLP